MSSASDQPSQPPQPQPLQIDLAKITPYELGQQLTPREVILKPPEHPEDRASRLADQRHERWRKSIESFFIDILARWAVLGVIVFSLGWSGTVLADQNSTKEAVTVADGIVKIVIGSITGFAVGKSTSGKK